MKIGISFRLAQDSIRKNKQLYLPYILTCIGMICVYYIIVALGENDLMELIPGGDSVKLALSFGAWVIAIFACIFLFYTNSFLMKRRKKEMGLYHILGMGKKHIGRILICESLIVSFLAFAGGLFFGILLYKLAELGLVNVVQGEVTYHFYISLRAIRMTVTIFCGIFVLILLNALRQIYFTGTMDLIKSDKTGEKVPKANWIMAAVGLLILGGAYYIAVSIKQPIEAIVWFFIAVVMVIIATYILMIAGSVTLCRLLQKNPGYYYKANHFVSVSSMAYRMKRNGAGLASICILATMVLVMMASTSSLYIGSEDELRNRYPRQIGMELQLNEQGQFLKENRDLLMESIKDSLHQQSITPINIMKQEYAFMVVNLNGDNMEMEGTLVDAGVMDHLAMVRLVTLEDYNAAEEEKTELADEQLLLYSEDVEYQYDTIGFADSKHYQVTVLDKKPACIQHDDVDVVDKITIVVPDMDSFVAEYSDILDSVGNNVISYYMDYDFDIEGTPQQQMDACDDFMNAFLEKQGSYSRVIFYSREANRTDFISGNGSLFYLGILLSIVFLFAAVLIIYYKQISEGYEDKSRFEIMKKVGMTEKEIRKSINSQLLTVFFFPLIFAGLHVAFAFPMIEKILRIFSLTNRMLFALVTLGCFLIFGILYTVVYKITSNAYYHIVSSQ